jgi:hypothetical protein
MKKHTQYTQHSLIGSIDCSDFGSYGLSLDKQTLEEIELHASLIDEEVFSGQTIRTYGGQSQTLDIDLEDMLPKITYRQVW